MSPRNLPVPRRVLVLLWTAILALGCGGTALLPDAGLPGDPGILETGEVPGLPEDGGADSRDAGSLPKEDLPGTGDGTGEIPEGQDVVSFPCREPSDCETAVGPAPACHSWACSGGACVPDLLPEETPCDDRDACTRNDFCREGRCIGSPVQCPEEAGSCTGRVCDPGRGCVDYPRTGNACDDGDLCTAEDRCILGSCRGSPVRCDDGDPCTEDSCDPASGCRTVTIPGAPCDDGEPCTVEDACLEDGTCQGRPDACDDDNPCTDDSCTPGVGCLHRPIHGRACDDRSLCTLDDHCESGRCVGTLVDCRDGNPCTRDACDPDSGCIHPPADGVPCDDGNSCTDVDLCLGGSCQGRATACEDGNPCSLDSCTQHSGCIHRVLSGIPCEDGDACTVGDSCVQGRCIPGGPAVCDDGNPCTADSCDPARGCLHDRLPGATPCDDGNACTAADRCVFGTCVGDWTSCDDLNPCTDDSCDPGIGCVHVSATRPCDDGDPCTAGDFCAGGTCHPGRNPQCLAIRRVVLAGDSWSTGFIQPLRDALDARGYEEVVVSWETTSKPGSTVAGWLADPGLMGALAMALDMEPPAGMLLFTLGGNDYLRACNDGLGLLDAWGWYLALGRIQADLQTFVNIVRTGRPGLRIVLIGYDYLNYLLIEALSGGFPGMDMGEFNLGLVELASLGRAVGETTPNMVYAHNMGLMQHVFGDPLFGYGPGAAPRPGPAPGYAPFPGGWWTHPSPAGHIPDGIHPDYAGFRALIEHTLDQGPAAFIEGRPWP